MDGIGSKNPKHNRYNRCIQIREFTQFLLSSGVRITPGGSPIGLADPHFTDVPGPPKNPRCPKMNEFVAVSLSLSLFSFSLSLSLPGDLFKKAYPTEIHIACMLLHVPDPGQAAEPHRARVEGLATWEWLPSTARLRSNALTCNASIRRIRAATELRAPARPTLSRPFPDSRRHCQPGRKTWACWTWACCPPWMTMFIPLTQK